MTTQSNLIGYITKKHNALVYQLQENNVEYIKILKLNRGNIENYILYMVRENENPIKSSLNRGDFILKSNKEGKYAKVYEIGHKSKLLDRGHLKPTNNTKSFYKNYFTLKSQLYTIEK